MPFTFSHPAIILPLRYLPKSWFSLTSLIIGSLIPDIEYFLRMKVKSNYSHTFTGIFWFDLPLALLLAFVFHNIIRNLLFQNLPSFMKTRILTYTDFNWNVYFKKNWHIVLISLLIGIISHLFWDSFTHKNGYFVNEINSFRNTIYIFSTEIPLWKIAQHGSTFIGSIALLIVFLKLPQDFNIKTPIEKLYWKAVILCIATILLLRFAVCFQDFNIGNFIVTFIASFIISTILIPSLIKIKSGVRN
ncbi:putative membrane protein [Flavobacterium nitrogenifigens]|uniref:Membrane protein n=2 Tax=Flavobacterium TaxID=237 RepID=A0ABR6QHE4_9FLAO|nr:MULTISPECIES: DUF4184 family protein [Flavobacterium]MBB4803570.1 putative membrane protein [Flavobacterium nitrogenifigens]MBB6388625.1 putative membrane protein [Flavobacterium notoginsengisoli]